MSIATFGKGGRSLELPKKEVQHVNTTPQNVAIAGCRRELARNMFAAARTTPPFSFWLWVTSVAIE